MANLGGGYIEIKAWWEDFSWAEFKPVNWWNNITLLGLAQRMGATRILEIGIGPNPHGVYLLGLHAKFMGSVHKAIDIKEEHVKRGRAIAHYYDLPVEIIHENSSKCNYSSPLDILYIDGGHTKKQCKSDIMTFSPSVVKDGLCIIDDYLDFPAVTEAIDECYSEAWEQIGLLHHRWAIWRKL